MHADLRGGGGLRGRDGRGHRVQIGLAEESPHPAWMTRHHQLPLEPPPPKLPPPPLNPPPLLPPPLPPPNPPPPMNGPPQPDEPPGPPAAPHPRALPLVLHEDRDQHEHHEQRAQLARAQPARAASLARRRRARVGAGDRAVDGVEPRRDAVRGASLAEARGDDVPENGGGDRVGEPALEPVADLDAHLPVVEEDEEDDAVVEALLADPPRLGQPDRVALEALALERAEDGDHHLVAAGGLPGRELLLEAVPVGGGQRARVVVDAPVGRRRNGKRRRARRGQQHQEQRGERHAAEHRPAPARSAR